MKSNHLSPEEVVSRRDAGGNREGDDAMVCDHTVDAPVGSIVSVFEHLEPTKPGDISLQGGRYLCHVNHYRPLVTWVHWISCICWIISVWLEDVIVLDGSFGTGGNVDDVRWVRGDEWVGTTVANDIVASYVGNRSVVRWMANTFQVALIDAVDVHPLEYRVGEGSRSASKNGNCNL